MKKSCFIVLSLLVLVSFPFMAEGERSAGEIDFGSSIMVPLAPQLTSVGVDVYYRLNPRWDLMGNVSIVPVALLSESVNFHSTIGGRFYFSDKRNAFFCEVEGGLFGGFSDGTVGVFPLAVANGGYQFPLAFMDLSIGVGVFYLLDSDFSIPFPSLTLDVFF